EFEIERTADTERENIAGAASSASGMMLGFAAGPSTPAGDSFTNAETSSASISGSSVTNREPVADTESTPRWIAETVALTPEEASRSLAEEMQQAQLADASPATDAQVSDHSAEERAHVQEMESQPEPSRETNSASGAAFAAAASAGGPSITDAVSSTPSSEGVEPQL